VVRVRPAIFLLLLGSCLASGCGKGGPQIYPVTGRVSFPDGSTLPGGGYVVFVSSDPAVPVRATGAFGTDGTFRLSASSGDDGLQAGEYNVSIVPNALERASNLSPAEYQRALHPIDKRYLFPKSSGLSFTVSAETAPHDFKIEVTKPRRKRR